MGLGENIKAGLAAFSLFAVETGGQVIEFVGGSNTSTATTGSSPKNTEAEDRKDEIMLGGMAAIGFAIILGVIIVRCCNNRSAAKHATQRESYFRVPVDYGTTSTGGPLANEPAPVVFDSSSLSDGGEEEFNLTSIISMSQPAGERQVSEGRDSAVMNAEDRPSTVRAAFDKADQELLATVAMLSSSSRTATTMENNPPASATSGVLLPPPVDSALAASGTVSPVILPAIDGISLPPPPVARVPVNFVKASNGLVFFVKAENQDPSTTASGGQSAPATVDETESRSLVSLSSSA